MKYDKELLIKLNEEYKNKSIMTSYPQYDHESQFQYAGRRIEKLSKMIDLTGKRILEVGCGGGYVSRLLAKQYKCDVTGIDIYKSNVWEELGSAEGLEHVVLDLSKENPFKLELFDVIISFVAWEHIKHPFKVLQECVKILKPHGKLYIYANQYRSAIASHLYRTIYFPFPQLLFPDEVIIEYCLENGVTQEWIDAFFYVNKLTYSHYKEYFRLLNLKIIHEKLVKRRLDLEFYKRFEDKLGLYPIFDLELDFFEVILCKDKSKNFIERQSITSYKLKPAKESPQKIGSTIRWSIEAFGVELQYAWYVYKDDEKIDTIWYTPNNYLDWTPKESGSYKIRVFIKDSSNNKISDISNTFIIE